MVISSIFKRVNIMKTSIIVASIVLIVIAVGVAGLYMTGYFTPQPTIRIGYLTGDLHQLPLHVAIANKYFEQNNLNITRYEFINGPTLMLHFLAGELDFAYVGAPPAITARASAMASGNVSYLPVVVSSVNLEGSALVVNPNVINSVTDLNGKKIGTPGSGTIQDIMLSIYIVDNNLTLTKYPGSIANLPLQFGNGEIDGFIGWETAPSIAVINFSASVLLTSHDMMPNHQCCVLVVSSKFLAEHPDIVTKVVSVHNSAEDFINANPTEAKQIAANYTGLSMSIIDMAFSRIVYNKTVNVDSITTFVENMIQLHVITTLNASQVDSFVSGFVDTNYATIH
jgi:NitT/TauT family transport system substrate-binding protein